MGKVTYRFFQTKREYHERMGIVSLDRVLEKYDGYPSRTNYDLVYEDAIEQEILSFDDINAFLEELFVLFNCAHPDDYRNRSMMTGDVVELEFDEESKMAWFCESHGWSMLDFTKWKGEKPNGL